MNDYTTYVCSTHTKTECTHTYTILYTGLVLSSPLSVADSIITMMVPFYFTNTSKTLSPLFRGSGEQLSDLEIRERIVVNLGRFTQGFSLNFFLYVMSHEESKAMLKAMLIHLLMLCFPSLK